MTWGFESLHLHNRILQNIFNIYFADLAQLAEHLTSNEEVGGSNPLVGMAPNLIANLRK